MTAALLILTILTCPPLHQQAAGVQTVIVLDFTDNSRAAGGNSYARLATDGVAIELANSGKYDVLKRIEVERTAKELNLKPPYDVIAKSKLAAALGATAIVDGSIEFVKETEKKGIRTVRVGLKVRVTEAASGDLIGGAAVIGESSGPVRSDQKVSREKAGEDAVRTAVPLVRSKKLVEGRLISTVSRTPAGQVLMDRGERDGVQIGMLFKVIRGEIQVGVIRALTVFPTNSEAEIVENRNGLRPEDRVREIVEEPHFKTADQLIDAPKRRK